MAVPGPAKRSRRQREASLVRRLSLVMHVVSILHLSAACARAMAVAGAVLSSSAAGTAAGMAATGHGRGAAAASATARPGPSPSGKSFGMKRAQAASAFVSGGGTVDERPERSARMAARSRAVRFLVTGWLHLLLYAFEVLTSLAAVFLVHDASFQFFLVCGLWHC